MSDIAARGAGEALAAVIRLFDAERFEDASALIDRSEAEGLGICERFPELLYLKALSLRRSNKFRLAMQEARRYQAGNPSSPENNKLIADLTFILGRNCTVGKFALKGGLERISSQILRLKDEGSCDAWLEGVGGSIDAYLAEVRALMEAEHLDFLSRRVPWSGGYFVEKDRLLDELIVSGLPDAPFGKGFDERVVEIPWAVEQMRDAGTVLDAGSAFNHPVILKHLKGKKTYIATLYPESHHDNSGVSYLYEDLRRLPFRDGHFDAIASVSTIEHIGLNCNIYKKDDELAARDVEQGSHLDAVLEMKRITRRGGKILITAPFGKSAVYHNSFRQFDAGMVHDIIGAVDPALAELLFYAYTGSGWCEVPAAHCSHFAYRENGSPGAGAVFLLSMTI